MSLALLQLLLHSAVVTTATLLNHDTTATHSDTTATHSDTTATHSDTTATYYVMGDLTVATRPRGPVAAVVEYNDLINSTGWSTLTVRTNASCKDMDQAAAAGVGEGYATATRILQSWINTMSGYCKTPSDYCDKLFSYINDNSKWINLMIEKHSFSEDSPYWYHMGLIQRQLWGLHKGFSMVYPDTLTVYDFYLMNLSGDLIDLEAALDSDAETSTRKRPTSSRDEEYMKHVLGNGHCSAFIKLLPDDILASHVTWNSYTAMIRVVKKYELNYRSGPGSKELMPGRVQVTTSYPGFVASGDDYTLIGSGILAQETTIGNFNEELWKWLSPDDSVPEYMRSLLASRLAGDGRSWCRTFQMYNSGTYNNQWMIIDYNLFTPGQPLKPGTLHVLEQLPGTVMYRDKTDFLSQEKYWPSYNTPSYPSIFNLSGSQELVDKYGPFFAYETNPRALIFKRDNHTVTDMETLYNLMRYNDYTHDPLARCECTPPYSAINAIASRADLNPDNGTYPLPLLGPMLSGATDYKGTNFELMKSLGMRVAGGPTWEQQPPFRWSTSPWSNVSHVGMPDLQQFKEFTVLFDQKDTIF